MANDVQTQSKNLAVDAKQIKNDLQNTEGSE